MYLAVGQACLPTGPIGWHGVALIGRLPSPSIAIRNQSELKTLWNHRGERTRAKSEAGNAAVTSGEPFMSAACKLEDHLGWKAVKIYVWSSVTHVSHSAKCLTPADVLICGSAAQLLLLLLRWWSPALQAFRLSGERKKINLEGCLWSFFCLKYANLTSSHSRARPSGQMFQLVVQLKF